MTIFKRTLFLLTIIGALFGCKKVEDDVPGPGGPDPLIPAVSAKVANKDWNAKNFVARVSNGHIFIYCSTSDGNKLQMEINSTALGTYLVNKYEENNASYFQDSTKKYYSDVQKAYEGKIVLTAYDTVNGFISGTFDLTLAEATTKDLISVEGGVFNRVPIVTAGFEPVHFIGLFRDNGATTTKMVDITIDEIGQVEMKNLLSVGNFTPGPASNFSTYNSATGIYNFISSRYNEFLYYKGANYALRNDFVYGHGAPVIFNGKCYGMKAVNGSGVAQFTEINQTNGDTINTVLSFATTKQFRSERISSSPIGSGIFFLSGDVLEKINPGSLTHTTYDLNPQNNTGIYWDGVEAISETQVIAIKSVNETSCTLAKITLGGSAPDVSQLIDFSVPSCLGCDFSTLYDKSKNIYYLFSYETTGSGVTTTIRSFNLNTNATGVSVYSGRIFGSEMLN